MTTGAGRRVFGPAWNVAVNASRTLPTSLRIGCAVALLAGAAAVSEAQTAQTTNRSVRAVPQPAAPVVQSLPSPSGLASPLPSPAGLTSQFPAGLPSPLPGAAVTTPRTTAGLPPTAGGTLPSLGTGGGRAPSDLGVVPQTAVMGAAGYGGPGGYGGVPAERASPGVGSGPYTALQIAQSFLGADANRDGELTRAEAQRLTIMPYSFEEMDRNHDGILTRFEYEDGVR